MSDTPIPALEGNGVCWSRAQLDAAAALLAAQLQARGSWVLATLLDNSPAWVVADLAASLAGVVHVPLPVFFSAQQIAHALQAAGVDTVLTSSALAEPWPQIARQECEVAGQPLVLVRLPGYAVSMPPCSDTRRTA